MSEGMAGRGLALRRLLPALPEAPAGDHYREGYREERHRQAGENYGNEGDVENHHLVQPDDAESVEGTKDDLAVGDDGRSYDEHPGGVPGLRPENDGQKGRDCPHKEAHQKLRHTESAPAIVCVTSRKRAHSPGEQWAGRMEGPGYLGAM